MSKKQGISENIREIVKFITMYDAKYNSLNFTELTAQQKRLKTYEYLELANHIHTVTKTSGLFLNNDKEKI